jgi:signal transduction histidine kinase
MAVEDSLQKIKKTWVTRLTQKLALAERTRQSFAEQLDTFYDRLTRAIETGDPGWLKPVVDDWIASRTESETHKSEVSIQGLLHQFMTVFFETAADVLSPEDALSAFSLALPAFTQALEYASNTEIASNIQQISADLEKAKTAVEKLERNKSDFISIAAHELKTPLTIIEGYSDMLFEHLGQNDVTELTRLYLEGIQNGSKRLQDIVEKMIDVSIIDNDQLTLNFQPFLINQLLKSVYLEFKSSAQERNLILEYKPIDGMEELHYGDEERLQQAIRNVVENAIKFTPDGGSIKLSGRTLAGFIEIQIEDTGIGIALDDQSRIFEKFGHLEASSLHSSSKTRFKGGGPGLGLPIAKGIIEAHGGTIWVESDGNDEVRTPGSTFHLMIPVIKEPPESEIARIFTMDHKETLEHG